MRDRDVHFARLCRGFACVLLACCLGLAPATAPATQPARTPFTSILSEQFDTWDTDDDGVLELFEVDQLVVDPQITGDLAAAVAAVKIALRSGKFELPPLTIDYFNDYARQVIAKKRPSPNFDGYFRSSKRRIAGGGEIVWPEKLSLANLRQGSMGDCYFISVVGAMIERDADDVKSMVSQLPDGSFQINFPSTQPIVVAPLTQAQIAISGTTTGEGAWLAILEHGFGRMRAIHAGKHDVLEVTDFIARGGTTGSGIAALTGNGRITIGMPRDRDAGEAGMLPRLRRELMQAMKHRRIVTAGVAALPTTMPTTQPTTRPLVTDDTGISRSPATQPSAQQPMRSTTRPSRVVTPRVVPAGINTKHAYAVLSYDPETDTIELWNPHGRTFKPKGPAGLKHGYPTIHGRFTVPLPEAYRFLSNITIESDTPATQPSTRPTGRAAPPSR